MTTISSWHIYIKYLISINLDKGVEWQLPVSINKLLEFISAKSEIVTRGFQKDGNVV